MIAAQGNQRCACLKDLACRRLCPPIVFVGIKRIGRDVAAVHHLHRPITQQRAAQIPVEVHPGAWLFPGSILRILANGIRSTALVVGQIAGDVGQAKGNTKNGDIRIKRIQVQGQWKPQKTVGRPRRGFGEGARHGEWHSSLLKYWDYVAFLESCKHDRLGCDGRNGCSRFAFGLCVGFGGSYSNPMDAIAKLNHWMMTEGRSSGDPNKVVSHFCSTLIDAGVPLWRVNIGQRFANPLLIAWGIVWTPEGSETYDVTHARMLTDGYIGSAFEYIMENQRPLHKSLRELDPKKDHVSYIEFAEAGGTDYYATLLDYGDGSQHGCTFATQAASGFKPEHLAMIEAAKPGLSSALEPMTMRKSTQSLLRTYLGDGPSEAVWNGTIQRGERTTLDAVVMFTDLRGFTALSDTASEEEIFDALNGYFDLVVQSVTEKGGDVLKFMGDGILSIFAIQGSADRSHQCRQAVLAAQGALTGLVELNKTRVDDGTPPLDVGIGINVGQVSYGNIGSPGRLDFTVLGGAVNVASRIEGLTKTIGARVLATATVAQEVPELFSARGRHDVRGLSEPVEVFSLFDPAA